MQAELRDDAVDGAFADTEVALAELLGNDLGAGLRIEEAVADHLADEFQGASVIGLGATFGAEEAPAALVQKPGAKLEVALAAKTELGGGGVNAEGTQFTFEEHGELAGEFIALGNG